MMDACRCGHPHRNPGPCRAIRRGVRCSCPERADVPERLEDMAQANAPTPEPTPLSEGLARPRRRMTIATVAALAAMFGAYHERPER